MMIAIGLLELIGIIDCVLLVVALVSVAALNITEFINNGRDTETEWYYDVKITIKEYDENGSLKETKRILSVDCYEEPKVKKHHEHVALNIDYNSNSNSAINDEIIKAINSMKGGDSKNG